MSLSQDHDKLHDILSRSNLAVITYGPDTVLGMCALCPWTRRSFGHRQLVCEILSRSNLAVRSYGPDMDFRYMCTVTLTSEIWQRVKVMTLPWVMDNNCVKYYPHQTWQSGVMARTRISSICALWPWHWRYDLGSRSWHFLGSWTTIVWNIIHIKHGSQELWPGHGFPVYVHCDLDIGDMTLGQGHDTPLSQGQQLCEIISRSEKGVRSYGPDTMWTDGQTDRWTDRTIPIYLGQGQDTPLGNGQQLCEISSRSNLPVRSYGPDTDFQYVCTVTLTLEIWPWPWVKVMTHPWVKDNNCVKLYPDRKREDEVMAWTQCEQTDRQTGWFLYTPPNFVYGVITNEFLTIQFFSGIA